MSKKQQVLIIEPDKYYSQKPERITFADFECPTCNGMKGTWCISNDEFTKCDRCKGTGRLEAEVEIRWRGMYLN
ncbi:MAG: hypothetical protein ACK5MG_09715 [Bacteroidales bacterium]